MNNDQLSLPLEPVRVCTRCGWRTGERAPRGGCPVVKNEPLCEGVQYGLEQADKAIEASRAKRGG